MAETRSSAAQRDEAQGGRGREQLLEQALAEAQQRVAELEATLARIPSGVVIWGADGLPVRMNAAAETILGYTVEQRRRTEQRPPGRVWRAPSDRPLEIDRLLAARALAGETDVVETCVTRDAAGENQWFHIRATPLTDENGVQTGAVSVMTDMSADIKAMCAAEKHAAELDVLLDSVPDGVAIYEADGRLRRMNAAFRRIFGYTPEHDHLTTQERALLCRARTADGQPMQPSDNPALRALKGEIVRAQRVQVRSLDSSERIVQLNAVPLRNAAAAVTGAILAAQDITELHEQRAAMERMAEEARNRAAELEAVFAAMGDAVVYYDLEGRVVRANEAACRILQWKEVPDEQPFAERAAHAHLRDEHGRAVPSAEAPALRALRGETIAQEVFAGDVPDGREIWLTCSAAPVRDAEDRPVGAIITFSDITELKRAERVVRTSEEHLRLAAQAAHFGIFDHDLIRGDVYWSPEYRRIFGYPLDAPPLPVWEMPDSIHPEDRKLVLEVGQRALEPTGDGAVDYELRTVREDGAVRWVQQLGRVDFAGEGALRRPIRASGVALDITERKQTREALQESEQRYRSLFESMAEGFAHCQIIRDEQRRPVDLLYLTTNRSFCAQAGVRDLSGQRLSDLGPGAAEAAEEDIVRYARVADSGQTDTWEGCYAGTQGWYRIIAYPAGRDQFIALFVDVTELKQSEEALRESREQIAAELADNRVLQAISARLIEQDEVTDLHDSLLDAAMKLMRSDFASLQVLQPDGPHKGALCLAGHRGFTPEATAHWQWVESGDSTACGESLRRGQSVAVRDVEACGYIAGTSELQWFRHVGIRSIQTTRLVSRSGQVVGMISTQWREPHEATERERGLLDVLARQAADLIERRQAEETLRETAQYLQNLFDYANAPIIVWNPPSRVTHFNHALERLTGRAAAEVVGQTVDLLFPPGDAEAAMARVRAATAGEHWEVVELPIQRADGSVRTVLWNSAPLRGPDGQTIVAIIAQGQDITERKHAEQELRRHRDDLEDLVLERSRRLAESEQKYRQVVEAATSVILKWDAEGTLVLANPYAHELFGYGPGELVGQPATIILPEEDSQGQNLKLIKDAILADPENWLYNENENVTRDGRRLWLAWTNRVIVDADGRFEGIMSIGADRTAQHQAELELAAERERVRELAAELALAEQKERRRLATALHDEVAQTLGALKMQLSTVAHQHPLMAAELSPSIAMAGDAIKQTRTIMAELTPPVLQQHGLAAAVRWQAERMRERHGLEVRVEAPRERLPLSSDAKLALFQAVRELLQNILKHSGTLGARVTVCTASDEVVISVADDGAGFDPALTAISETGGYGLFSIQERMRYMGGRATIRSAPGEGTEVTLRLPCEE